MSKKMNSQTVAVIQAQKSKQNMAIVIYLIILLAFLLALSIMSLDALLYVGTPTTFLLIYGVIKSQIQSRKDTSILVQKAIETNKKAKKKAKKKKNKRGFIVVQK